MTFWLLSSVGGVFGCNRLTWVCFSLCLVANEWQAVYVIRCFASNLDPTRENEYDNTTHH